MIEIVPNEPRYFEFIRNLRNDPRVKDGFIEEGHITQAQQTSYMADHSAEYVVALADGVPAGYGGSVAGDIRVCTHPDFQGRGIGAALVQEVLARFPGSSAKVKAGNEASLRLFESLGFETTYVIMEARQGDSRGGGTA